MTRAEFMARLKQGLVGLPTTTAADIVSDYHAHFEDGMAAGRTEEQVASALGDPDRLSRELKAESTARRWGQEQSPSSAAAAVFGILGLGALDIIILLPLFLPIVGTVLAMLVTGVFVFFGGGFVLAVGPFMGLPGGAFAAILLGIGVMGLGVFMTGLMVLLTKWLIDATVWYARLHYRVLKPALEPQSHQPVYGA